MESMEFQFFFLILFISCRTIFLSSDIERTEFDLGSGNGEVEVVEPHVKPNTVLTSGVMKRSAHSGVQNQCEGLSSGEYCICKYCSPILEKRCIQRCRSNFNPLMDEHPLDHYHTLVGKVLNQSECWVCSHVPQGQDNIGLVPFPLNYTEVHEL